VDIRAELIGYPRIGRNRELKWALEREWSGRSDIDALLERAAELRQEHLAEQRDAIGSAVDDYFLYDEVLETAMMLGLVPEHARGRLETEPFGVLTGLARGTPEREAWEMTKWFDTNYHYVVPEVDRLPDRVRPMPWREPIAADDVTWPILGPYSLVKLSKLADGIDPVELAARAGTAIWDFARARGRDFRLQLDEPYLGLTMSDQDRQIRDAAYAGAGELGLASPPRVTVQFGAAAPDTIERLGRLGLAVQVPADHAAALASTSAWASQREHVIAVMDGRSVWPDDFAVARDAVTRLPDDGRRVTIIPSTNLGFLPYTVEGEDLPAGFQFAHEKARTLAAWAESLVSGATPETASPPQAVWAAPGALAQRATRDQRRAAQQDLNLPPYPTTTTGSLPQTGEVRQLRVQLAKGELSPESYDTAVAKLITDAIAWQEQMGLDVLVHGEFERTDMVEYFAEQMDGFLTTRNGWVLSYGSRCTRPPILAAPPSISEPMTVTEWKLAQSATAKPVKGMLTGPVTIVNWSFRPPAVPDDQLFWAVAQPIAEEIEHLVEAGARIIQVDEPAVRERWPLPTEDAADRRAIYARGVRAALNHVFNQPEQVQLHTHMCYGDFGDIVPLWADAGVDVASIEFSRSKDDSYIRQFYDLFSDGHLQIGPGVFDVHSPHTPGSSTMDERLRHFEVFMESGDLWVNPDCGLKTRGWDEIERQLSDMVAAARSRREASRIGTS
jgi:5-methyltetrahydropteroyltriglutamate--homocysteine methyltransferase